MSKYLYLTRKEWVSTWENGGSIPIPIASRFLSHERSGTQTTDENRFHRSSVDLTKLPGYKIGPDATIVGLNLVGVTVNGVRQPDIVGATCGTEDGLIICLSNGLERSIAERLGKSACVEIFDAEALKECINAQVGNRGANGRVRVYG